MDNPSETVFRVGDWRVNVASNEISNAGATVRLDPRLLRLLLCLVERAGQIVSTETVLKVVWPEVVVTPDSVYQAIASLRRALCDDPKRPTYIVTLPRVGYRLIAPAGPAEAIEVPEKASSPQAAAPARRTSRRAALAFTGLAVLAAIVAVGALDYRRARASAETIAVLPILDLTSEAMDQEYFADGMTEELIERLTQVPGMRVSSASASFHYKSTHLPIPEIAQALGVHYLLDGSVRQSGATLRVSARLLRAEDGFVLWTETYDRDSKDLLRVQDDIANEVSQHLKEWMQKGAKDSL
jgi:transcriptional activator of cad operon